MRIGNAPKTIAAFRIHKKARVSKQPDQLLELCCRLFRDTRTALTAKRLIELIHDSNKQYHRRDWETLIKLIGVDRSTFYWIRNKLLAAGILAFDKRGYYTLSGVFSRDLVNVAAWWWVDYLGYDKDSLYGP
jgi:hypothetical protein